MFACSVRPERHNQRVSLVVLSSLGKTALLWPIHEKSFKHYKSHYALKKNPAHIYTSPLSKTYSPLDQEVLHTKDSEATGITNAPISTIVNRKSEIKIGDYNIHGRSS